jgi:hypothetical protein
LPLNWASSFFFLPSPAHVRPLSYTSLVLSSFVLLERLCLLVLFLVIFFAVFNDLLSAEDLLKIDAAAMAVGMITVLALQWNSTEQEKKHKKEKKGECKGTRKSGVQCHGVPA